MILLCQGAGGLWTGLGWVTPDWVDKLLLGHTVRQKCARWGREVDDHVALFSSYSRSGAQHTIIALPDVALEGSIETIGDVISAFEGS